MRSIKSNEQFKVKTVDNQPYLVRKTWDYGPYRFITPLLDLSHAKDQLPEAGEDIDALDDFLHDEELRRSDIPDAEAEALVANFNSKLGVIRASFSELAFILVHHYGDNPLNAAQLDSLASDRTGIFPLLRPMTMEATLRPDIADPNLGRMPRTSRLHSVGVVAREDLRNVRGIQSNKGILIRARTPMTNQYMDRA